MCAQTKIGLIACSLFQKMRSSSHSFSSYSTLVSSVIIQDFVWFFKKLFISSKKSHRNSRCCMISKYHLYYPKALKGQVFLGARMCWMLGEITPPYVSWLRAIKICYPKLWYYIYIYITINSVVLYIFELLLSSSFL